MSDNGRSRGSTKRVAPGGAPSHNLRRRLIPYGLLAPGTIWLILFCSAIYPPMLLVGASVIGAGGMAAMLRGTLFPRSGS